MGIEFVYCEYDPSKRTNRFDLTERKRISNIELRNFVLDPLNSNPGSAPAPAPAPAPDTAPAPAPADNYVPVVQPIITPTPAPTNVPAISNFVSAANNVSPNTTVMLSAIFSNGNGIITPGDLPITSNGSVSVTPSATTIYTLQVTNSISNLYTRQNLTVVIVVADPTISSFTADGNNVAPNTTVNLRALFSDGVGYVTFMNASGSYVGSNYSITSGQLFPVMPTATTTYTLTVTNTRNVARTASVTVNVTGTASIDYFVWYGDSGSQQDVVLGAVATSAMTNLKLVAVFPGSGVVTSASNFTLSLTSNVPSQILTFNRSISWTFTLTVTAADGSTATRQVSYTP